MIDHFFHLGRLRFYIIIINRNQFPVLFSQNEQQKLIISKKYLNKQRRIVVQYEFNNAYFQIQIQYQCQKVAKFLFSLQKIQFDILIVGVGPASLSGVIRIKDLDSNKSVVVNVGSRNYLCKTKFEYEDDVKQSWIYDELSRSRNFKGSFQYNIYFGLIWEPWNIKSHVKESESYLTKDQVPQIKYEKPDRKLTFDFQITQKEVGPIMNMINQLILKQSKRLNLRKT
ncbi:unnamed protein product (macronuclear) [Paramecium tetraurelia]|uniref:Electron transfer flavoprotein-ubiquinone oxidoreductase n=1 Tax=Paramecium tetraurelia TaxID=5888 RepID=A0EHC7_PARTE|nr:uncharacterized protein GSPATT00027042001 [Paramecium tetraurelia]CAK94718.1 unnamed protein product [Paramecium tetraurelia]|eukprot:XP_001462091.1 hypothetical protein (macronuclear) [Paramecium tetraurelia strain d4-2]